MLLIRACSRIHDDRLNVQINVGSCVRIVQCHRDSHCGRKTAFNCTTSPTTHNVQTEVKFAVATTVDQRSIWHSAPTVHNHNKKLVNYMKISTNKNLPLYGILYTSNTYRMILYVQVFDHSLRRSLPDTHLQKRLNNIINTLSLNVYNYACTGMSCEIKRYTFGETSKH